jgi:prepilin-type N-terminal cleavage/methylation domain-containing protein
MLTDKKGFTLVELISVIAVIAALASLAIPLMTNWLANAEYREASQMVVQALRQARNNSVARNREYRVEFDLAADDAYSFRVREGSRAANTPAPGAEPDPNWANTLVWGDAEIPQTVVLRSGNNCLGNADFDFDFNPNGTTEAVGTICIMDTAGVIRYQVQITNTTTGRVTINRP